MTTNHPAHGPVSLDRLHQIREILSKAAAQSDGGNLGYAMADAVKVIEGAIAAFGAEPVAWRWFHLNQWHVTNDEELARDLAWDGVKVIPLYTAPPAPVAMKDHQIRELVNDLLDIAIGYHGAQQLRERIARTVRAAMLQAGNFRGIQNSSTNNCREISETSTNEHEIETHTLLKSIEGMEVSVDVSTCDADAGHRYFGTVTEISELDTAKNGYILLVQDAKPNFKPTGNSPVTPDGWIPVSDRMPERDVDVQVYCADKKEQMVGYMERNETEGWFRFASLPNGGGVYCKPTHWMPLPAAPQQEGK